MREIVFEDFLGTKFRATVTEDGDIIDLDFVSPEERRKVTQRNNIDPRDYLQLVEMTIADVLKMHGGIDALEAMNDLGMGSRRGGRGRFRNPFEDDEPISKPEILSQDAQRAERRRAEAEGLTIVSTWDDFKELYGIDDDNE